MGGERVSRVAFVFIGDTASEASEAHTYRTYGRRRRRRQVFSQVCACCVCERCCARVACRRVGVSHLRPSHVALDRHKVHWIFETRRRRRRIACRFFAVALSAQSSTYPTTSMRVYIWGDIGAMSCCARACVCVCVRCVSVRICVALCYGMLLCGDRASTPRRQSAPGYEMTIFLLRTVAHTKLALQTVLFFVVRTPATRLPMRVFRWRSISLKRMRHISA